MATKLSATSFQIVDMRPGSPDGTDTVSNVQSFQFADHTDTIDPALFAQPAFKFAAFAPGAGGWSSNNVYPRALADVSGDGNIDIVEFGDRGVAVALGHGDGSFGQSALTYAGFGAGSSAGGWSSTDLYPRFLADANGDGKIDIIGFGEAGVYAALGNGDGSFQPVVADLRAFGRSAGGWTDQDAYPRLLADVNSDGAADIVGFGYNGVYEALGFHIV